MEGAFSFKISWQKCKTKPAPFIAELNLGDGAPGKGGDRGFLREERRIGHMI